MRSWWRKLDATAGELRNVYNFCIQINRGPSSCLATSTSIGVPVRTTEPIYFSRQGYAVDRLFSGSAVTGSRPYSSIVSTKGADFGALPEEEVQCVVIGAGVIGLAIARQLALSGKEVIVVESGSTFGTGTSSRNSEVVHGGLYYPPGSLKVIYFDNTMETTCCPSRTTIS